MTQRQAPWGTSDSFLPSGAIDYHREPIAESGLRIPAPFILSGRDPHSFSASVPANHHPPVGFYGPAANGSVPPPQGQHVLLSPFNPSRISSSPPRATHHPQPGIPPPRLPPLATNETVAARKMLGDDAIAGIERQCRCLFCSRGHPHQCPVEHLEQRQLAVRTAWTDLEKQLRGTREMIQELSHQQVLIVRDYHRSLSDDELQRLLDERYTLYKRIQELEVENLRLMRDAYVRNQRTTFEHGHSNQPVIHHGSFQGNTPSVDGGPPPPAANQQSGRAGGDDGARSVPDTHRWPSYHSLPFDSNAAAEVSPQTSASRPGGWTHLVRPVNVEANERPTPPMGSPAVVTGSLTPPRGPVTSPPLWISPYSPVTSEMRSRSIAGSEPKRSPKRLSSAVNASHANSGPDGISSGSGAGQVTAFAEASAEGSPPSKRRCSLSRDYYIVADERGEEEEEEAKEEEEEEEETRRLTMHAGHTPNDSPSVPSGTALRPSGGSMTLLRAEDDAPLRRAESSFSLPNLPISSFYPLAFQRRLTRAEEDAILGRREGRTSSSPSSQIGLLKTEDDAPLNGPLMIRNIPAQDELFLATLNERLQPISQGQDALPRAVQPPVALPAPLSAVSGVRIGGAGDNQNVVPDNADPSRSQSDTDEESDGVDIKEENIFPFGLGGEDEHQDQGRDAHVKTEPRAVTVKTEDSDEDSDSKGGEPDLPIKFRSTSNFGAPFGRRA